MRQDSRRTQTKTTAQRQKEKQALKTLLKNIFQKNVWRIEIFRNFAAEIILG